jgi:uncharacterized protein with HEPN domain
MGAIGYNAALAPRFVQDISYEAFAKDERTLYAVTRCLEIISEASRRLPDELKARYSEVPWRQIAGSGNIYRHDYEDVLPSILWNTILYHLGVLERAVHDELEGQE